MEERINIENQHQTQNLSLAIAAGLVSAVVMAVLWALLAAATGYTIGLMAFIVGLVVGRVVSFAGKSNDTVYGVIGAICAFLGSIIGNFLSAVAVVWQFANKINPDWSYFDALNLSLSDTQLIRAIVAVSFSSRIDIVFYGIAIWAGYYFAVRKDNEKPEYRNPLEDKTKQGQVGEYQSHKGKITFERKFAKRRFE
jgi:hypothetical protein